MSRVLANKCALSIRVDALGDKDTEMIGAGNRVVVENRLKQLEGREGSNYTAKQSPGPKKYDSSRDTENPALVREKKSYNPVTDTTIPDTMDVDTTPKKDKKRKRDEPDTPAKKKKTSESDTPSKSSKKDKKEKDAVKSEKNGEKTPTKDKKDKKDTKDKKDKKTDKKKRKSSTS
jgi:nucleolar protein 58